MRYPFRVLASLLGLTVGLVQVGAEQKAEAGQRAVTAAVLLVHGRLPAADELEGKEIVQPADVEGLFGRLREALSKNADARKAVARRAYFDAFGLVAGVEDIRRNPRAVVTYSEHVQLHLAQFARVPEAYEEVIHRAYRFVVRREAYEEELAYWKKHDALSYALLVGCIEHWARRNQPGLMVTTGVPTVPFNSEFLITAQVDSAVAQRLRAAAKLDSPERRSRNNTADARNVLAPGAAQLVAAGGMHFVAVGGEKLAAFGDER